MKSITCFIGGLGGGGAEHQMSILAELLKDKGYSVEIVTFIDAPDFYTLHPEVRRVRLAEGKASFIKVLSIFSFFLSRKTDIVISYTQRANLLCLFPLLFRRKILVIAGERNISGKKQTRRERVLFNFLYRRANYIVPNSVSQANYIKTKKPKLAAKVVPISNYTDIDSFIPSPLPLNNTLRIAVFARFQRQKNCIRFAEMLSRLKSCGHRPFVVDWYGRRVFNSPAQQDYYDSFVSKVQTLGIENVLHINNPIKDVPAQIKQCDILCLPSVLEGFSNAIAEGISSGRPMVVSDISDNSIMVHDGENGFLFNPYDVDSMLEAFIKIIDLPNETLSQMGLISREIAESLFDKDRYVGEYIALFDN